ncbi:MAG: hypothetical protein ACK5BR_05255 [Bacteroidota bacterium]|jgi:hypothetical protein
MLLRILFFILLSLPAYSQSYQLAVGSNLTSYLFVNSNSINPANLRAASGMHLSLHREAAISNDFYYDLGINYNQFNTVGDVQNIPLSYHTDFIGLGAGIGPHIKLGKTTSLVVKGRVSAVKMINGNQLLLNRYINLADDDQFNSLRTLYGLSLELRKQINAQVSTFVSYQYLTSYKQFIEPNKTGTSTVNFIPTTFSLGLVLSN